MAARQAKTSRTNASAIFLWRAVGFSGPFPLSSATNLRSPSPFPRSSQNSDKKAEAQSRSDRGRIHHKPLASPLVAPLKKSARRAPVRLLPDAG